MVSVAENHAAIERLKPLFGHRLDRPARSHRHEGRRGHIAMRRVQHPQSGIGLRICVQYFKSEQLQAPRIWLFTQGYHFKTGTRIFADLIRGDPRPIVEP